MLTAVKQCNNCFSSSLRDKLRDSCSQKIARIAFCWQCIQLIFSWQWCNTHTHTHTHPFNGPFSGTTQVSRYQKGKTNLDFTEARQSEWQWHQLGNMQVCISFQTGNHASTPALSFFTGWMPWQWCNKNEKKINIYKLWLLVSLCSPNKNNSTYLQAGIKRLMEWTIPSRASREVSIGCCVAAINTQPGTQWIKYLTTIFPLSYNNAKVTNRLTMDV